MTRYGPDKRHRRSIRLKGYDYTQPGAYFVTICVQNRECLFGEIVENKMRLNDAGRMIQAIWAQRFQDIELDAHIVMPNHFHAIVVIVGASPVGATNGASLVGATNGASLVGACNYEHIIRNERELNAARRYIHENPTRWIKDRENPD